MAKALSFSMFPSCVIASGIEYTERMSIFRAEYLDRLVCVTIYGEQQVDEDVRTWVCRMMVECVRPTCIYPTGEGDPQAQIIHEASRIFNPHQDHHLPYSDGSGDDGGCGEHQGVHPREGRHDYQVLDRISRSGMVLLSVYFGGKGTPSNRPNSE